MCEGGNTMMVTTTAPSDFHLVCPVLAPSPQRNDSIWNLIAREASNSSIIIKNVRHKRNVHYSREVIKITYYCPGVDKLLAHQVSQEYQQSASSLRFLCRWKLFSCSSLLHCLSSDHCIWFRTGFENIN